MNKVIYPLLTLLAVSLVFVGGNSFVQAKSYQANNWRWESASKMIGSQLRDQNGNTAGEVKDLVVDPSSGRIISDIVSSFRSNWVTLAIPFKDTFSKNSGGELLYTRPRETQRYYGQAPYWSEGLYAGQTWPTEGMKASKVIGAVVRASTGEVSHIKDLKIDFQYGQVWAIFPFDVAGSKKMVRMPLSWMHQRADNTFVLNFVE